MKVIKPRFRHLIRVWWAYFWRKWLVMLGGTVFGFIPIFLAAYEMRRAGFSQDTIYLATLPLAFVVSSLFSMIPIYMLLGRNFGTFRLVLVAKDDGGPSAAKTEGAGEKV